MQNLSAGGWQEQVTAVNHLFRDLRTYKVNINGAGRSSLTVKGLKDKRPRNTIYFKRGKNTFVTLKINVRSIVRCLPARSIREQNRFFPSFAKPKLVENFSILESRGNKCLKFLCLSIPPLCFLRGRRPADKTRNWPHGKYENFFLLVSSKKATVSEYTNAKNRTRTSTGN